MCLHGIQSLPRAAHTWKKKDLEMKRETEAAGRAPTRPLSQSRAGHRAWVSAQVCKAPPRCCRNSAVTALLLTGSSLALKIPPPPSRGNALQGSGDLQEDRGFSPPPCLRRDTDPPTHLSGLSVPPQARPWQQIHRHQHAEPLNSPTGLCAKTSLPHKIPRLPFLSAFRGTQSIFFVPLISKHTSASWEDRGDQTYS